MLSLRIIPYLLGRITFVLVAGMVFTSAIGATLQEVHEASVFFVLSLIFGFLGVLFVLSFPQKKQSSDNQSGTLSICAIWLLVPILCTLPMLAALPSLSFSNALFEAVSALTTSGFTVFETLADVPHTVILWRALLQWLGGFISLVAMSTIFAQLTFYNLPILKAHAEMRSEFSLYKRLEVIAGSLIVPYGLLTLLCFVLLSISGISVFQSFCIALSTLSTGGFMPVDGSIGSYHSLFASSVISVFMIAGSLNFFLYVEALAGRPRFLLTDPEAGVFLLLVALFSILFIAVLAQHFETIGHIFEGGVFAAASLLSTTGFVFSEKDFYDILPVPILMPLILIGGSMLSTCGGLKVARIIVLVTHSATEMRKLTHPHGVNLVRVAGRIIDQNVVSAVWVTLVLLLTISAVASIAIAWTGHDFASSVILAITSISNCGAIAVHILPDPPAIGSESWLFKACLITTMVIGRIEILILLPLFDRFFWAK